MSINKAQIKKSTVEIEALIAGIPKRPRAILDYIKLRESIQQLMSDHCGVIRNSKGLNSAHRQINEIYKQLESVYSGSNDYLELLSIATVAKTILEAALRRPESVGSHYIAPYEAQAAGN